MWRTILLGKMSISILACLVVGGICVVRPWRVSLTVSETAQWIGFGVFFLALAIVQILVIFLLTRKAVGIRAKS